MLTRGVALIMIVLGLAMVSIAIAGGGGPLAFGVLIGVLFIAAGAGRLWMQRS